jgi:hypothetical protein
MQTLLDILKRAGGWNTHSTRRRARLSSRGRNSFAPPQPKKTASKKATTTPTPIKAAKKGAAKKTTAKKEVAA